MSITELKNRFEQDKNNLVYESAILRFYGVEGYDVYNCSIPFLWEGKEYIFGRVERRDEWANSWVRLFERTGEDQYTLVKEHMIYQLEDPYISFVHGEIVLGGTHVRKRSSRIDTYYGYFYRGKSLDNLTYYTTGPDYMKDIRLVELADGRIGVFSRPRSEEIRRKYGSESIIGFTTIQSLEELTDEVILNAEPIEGFFDKDEWGGCNQAYLLVNGSLGIIGHQCYKQPVEDGEDLEVYFNVAFEFNPDTSRVSNRKIIGTRSCYPAAPSKKPRLTDCTFTSGIVMRGDGKANLYAGLSDAYEGRIVIDYPFSVPLR